MGIMPVEVKIDANAGFCSGVVSAIRMAENELSSADKLYCLGDIVHNNEEVERLAGRGLEVISYEKFRGLKNAKVLIRAHGEPPETYAIARESGIELVDATCPIVLALQQKIRNGFLEMRPLGGQVVIFGKKGHAEVIGLNGQTENSAIIISDAGDLEQVDFSRPIRMYSQTTRNKELYNDLIEKVRQNCGACGNGDFVAFNTICNRVSNRVRELTRFVESVDVVLFVSGRNSSNGKYLFEHCKSVKDNALFITRISELKKEWFESYARIGITGATSTPRWLMEQAADWLIKNL